MSKLGINTGTFADDGTGDSLLQGGIKINSNFNEIYSSIGNGSNINIGVGKSIISTSLSSGNVGIGTTNPTDKLHVLGGSITVDSATGGVNFWNGAGYYGGIGVADGLGGSGTDIVIRADSTRSIIFFTGGANDRGIIDSNGIFLVGTATSTGTASQPLQVTGGAYVSGSVGIGTNNPISNLHINSTVLRSIVFTGDSGSSYLVMGNKDSNGSTGPNVMQFGNRNLLFGVGDSFTSSTGGTFTEYMRLNSNANFIIGSISDTETSSQKLQVTGGAYVSGSVGIGTTNPTSKLHIGPGDSSANSSPLKFSQGTNLSSIESGVIEYDGTSFFATPNINYGRATIPTVIYNSGIGSTGIVASTNYALFPVGNSTITLPIGTYLARLRVRVAVTGSVVSSACSFSMRGSGNAVGSFSWGGTASILDAGAASSFIIAATALGTPFTVTTTSAGNPRQYIFTGEGILKVTTQGTIIPSYSFPSTLTSGTTTLVADNYIILQSLDTQSAAAFGPSGVGWI